MTTIYVIEQGEYDDYTVGPVFSNEDAAKKYVTQMNEIEGADKYQYSSWEMEDECPEIYRHIHLAYHYHYNETEMTYATDKTVETIVYSDDDKFVLVHGTDVEDVRRTYEAEKARRGL